VYPQTQHESEGDPTLIPPQHSGVGVLHPCVEEQQQVTQGVAHRLQRTHPGIPDGQQQVAQ